MEKDIEFLKMAEMMELEERQRLERERFILFCHLILLVVCHQLVKVYPLNVRMLISSLFNRHHNDINHCHHTKSMAK